MTTSVMGVVGPSWTYNSDMEAPRGEKDMGGWTAAVYTEEQRERLGVNEFGEKLPSASEVIVVEDPDTVGCCFNHGLGSMMVPCCFVNHRDSKKSECNLESHIGGKTAWDTRSCEEVKLDQGIPSGCCYDQGMSKGKEPCCFSNHRESSEADCDTSSRIGGRTVWESRSCDEIQREQQDVLSEDAKGPFSLFPGILPVMNHLNNFFGGPDGN